MEVAKMKLCKSESNQCFIYLPTDQQLTQCLRDLRARAIHHSGQKIDYPLLFIEEVDGKAMLSQELIDVIGDQKFAAVTGHTKYDEEASNRKTLLEIKDLQKANWVLRESMRKKQQSPPIADFVILDFPKDTHDNVSLKLSMDSIDAWNGIDVMHTLDLQNVTFNGFISSLDIYGRDTLFSYLYPHKEALESQISSPDVSGSCRSTLLNISPDEGCTSSLYASGSSRDTLLNIPTDKGMLESCTSSLNASASDRDALCSAARNFIS